MEELDFEKTEIGGGGKKTLVISLASIKGGVGKTHIVILLARFLARCGYRVLLMDSDLNNSLSFHFLSEEMFKKAEDGINLYNALGNEKNNLCDFALKTKTDGIDLIASSAYLADLRTLSEKRLKRMIPTLYGRYDVLLIDCHPTYDNIVLNALHASDYAITPVLKDTFSYNAARFFADVIPRDVESLDKWLVLLNGYDRRHEEAKTGRQYDFVELYRKSELPLLPTETWLPWTTQMHMLVDYNRELTQKKDVRGTVYNPELYAAVSELALGFFDIPALPEAF
jgi:chromosome partitioning protein